MMKIVASLIILGLCANVCFAANGVTPVSSTNGASAFSSSWLNSSATKVYTASNTTDAANWNSASSSTAVAGVPADNVVFGPGASNDTSYVYGIETSGTTISKIIKRTVNNTIVGWQNDTVEAAVVATDSAITTTIVAASGLYSAAVGPGYLALLTQGSDGTNKQVYVTLLSGTSPSSKQITSTLDIVQATTTTTQGCTTTSYTIGNIWYDMGAGAFFFTYVKNVLSYQASTAGAACSSTAASSSPDVNTIGLGGIYVNGTVYWSTPLSIATVTAANSVTTVVGGGDNWLNATNIYVAYLDSTIAGQGTGATGITYVSKTTKATSTTSGGSFSALATNTISGTSGAASYVNSQYIPVAVWASNFTFGVTVSNYTQYGATPTKSYTYTNYLNSTLTSQDSGLSSSSAAGFGQFWGWQLNTGYTLVASYATSSSVAYVAGTFYGNGTVNTTAATIATMISPVSFYEDLNGTQWVGWTDYDTSANALTYAGYLAKFQGQLNVPGSAANVLSAISAFVALFLAAIFVF